MTQTPASLLLRLRQADPGDAWDRFVELYTPLLYFWARRLGLQEADAADLVQDVLLQLVSALSTFQYDAGRTFRGYLRTILLNKWAERKRRRPVGQAGPRDLDNLAAPDPAEAFTEAEYRQLLVQRALELMQRDFHESTWRACREVLLLGRPAPEVAAEFGVSTASLHAARFRILCRLREELKGLLE